MTLKKYLFLMLISTVLCWLAWGLVLFFVNPQEAGAAGFALFYLSLFLGLLGIFSIIGFVFRYLLKRQEFAYQQVKTAFRQGFLFALLIIAALFLQGQGLLVWWNLLLLLGLLGVVEYFFVSSSERHPDPDLSGERIPSRLNRSC